MDKKLHYYETFPDLYCFFCSSQRAIKRLHYSEKFRDFVLSSAGVNERSKDYMILKSSRILLFLLQDSKMDNNNIILESFRISRDKKTILF